MQVSSAFGVLLLLDNAMSPSRPPQPTVAPSLPSDCQIDCWSLCENSFGGSGFATLLVELYCASEVGFTSGPTFSCTASLPWSHSDLSPANCGASAYCRLSVSVCATSGVRAVGASAARA